MSLKLSLPFYRLNMLIGHTLHLNQLCETSNTDFFRHYICCHPLGGAVCLGNKSTGKIPNVVKPSIRVSRSLRFRSPSDGTRIVLKSDSETIEHNIDFPLNLPKTCHFPSVLA